MIHQYKLNGFNIVLDVFSGSVHYVDELAYDIIGLYEATDKDTIVKLMLEKYELSEGITVNDIQDVFEDIESLKDMYRLFTENVYEEKTLNVKKNNTVIKALCLHIAHTCNLTCDYCFAAQGKFNGNRALMSFEVGKQAIDFLIKNSGARRNLDIDFFGGEPLMNFEVIKQIVAYGREQEKLYRKNIRFTLTTNGMLINDDVIEFANREMHNVVLSLDGRKEVHDHLRKTVGGKGSYDVIVPKFKELVDKRGDKEYYMRGTFTHNNVDFTEDVLHMADLGFKELSMEPVVCSPDSDYALTEEDLPELFRQYELLAVEMLKRKREGNGFTFYHYMIDLKGGPCVHKRIAGCGSGTEYLAVTPWGDLYPCHQFVNDESCKMGNVWEGVTNQEFRSEFMKCNAFERKECRECWASLYCSGGCAANAYNATGSIHGIYEYGCTLFKKRMECAIMMKVAEASYEEEAMGAEA